MNKSVKPLSVEDSAVEFMRGLRENKRAVPVEERTAEMEQLMGRLRELNGRGVLLFSSEVKILLDHIEGKSK